MNVCVAVFVVYNNYFYLFYSGIFELNFMTSQPASGYYQFSVAITGDTRLVASRVEVSWPSFQEKMYWESFCTRLLAR